MPDWERKYMGRWKMPNEEFVRRSDVLEEVQYIPVTMDDEIDVETAQQLINAIPAANVYTAHEVAEILAEVTGDDCACDVNGNDEWLPEFCEFSQTVCPDPAGVACWEQWLKWRDKRPKEMENDLD